MKVRRAVQAGYFYAGTKDNLLKEVEACFLNRLGPYKLSQVNPKGERKILGIVCPHAGFQYSGAIAAHSYAALAEDGVPQTAIIIGPNHTGIGSGVSIMNNGLWGTPLGEVEIDATIANEIIKASKIIDIDDSAHLQEHSLEVQLPFLQYLYGERLKIVPICLMMQDLATASEVGEAIAKAIRHTNTIIIASSDFTHYEPQKDAQSKDKKAIDAILNLDEERLHHLIRSEHMTMCGYGPVTSLIKAAKLLETTKTTLLSYHTSGDVTGDYGAVVGYASIRLSQ